MLVVVVVVVMVVVVVVVVVMLLLTTTTIQMMMKTMMAIMPTVMFVRFGCALFGMAVIAEVSSTPTEPRCNTA
jgi:hypothetical protein